MDFTVRYAHCKYKQQIWFYLSLSLLLSNGKLSAFFISNAKVIVIPIEEKKIHTLNIIHTHTLRIVDVKMVCASYRMADGDNFVVVLLDRL